MYAYVCVCIYVCIYSFMITIYSPIFVDMLTKVLTTVKDGLIRNYNTKTSHNGVNSMWIVKNQLDQLDVRTATLVQTYDFSTLYRSIPHNLLKSLITALIHNSFKRRNGGDRYTHIKITSEKGYFIDTISPGGDNLYTADQICRMVEFWLITSL